MGGRDRFRFGAQTAGDDDFAVLCQCVAYGSQRFRLCAIKKATRIDDRQVGTFVHARELITLRPQARDDALAVDQRLGASQ